MAREFDPMKMTQPDPNKIQCKDCLYRDRDQINLGDVVIKCGITKGYCDIFKEGGEDNGKPLEVLFQNASCPEYVKDDNA